MNKRWTPGSDAIVTRFPINSKTIEKDDCVNACEEKIATKENYKKNTHKEILSIIFAFSVVFVYFSGIYLLNIFQKLNFDNAIIFTVLISAFATFINNRIKEEKEEIIEFREPKI